MGLGNTTKATYLHFVMGKVRQRVESGLDGAKERTNSQGTKVYELIYDYIEGTITNIEKVTSDEYNDQFAISMTDFESGENYIIYVTEGAQSNKLFNKLLATKPNIPIRIIPHQFEDDGKSRSEFTVQQDGKKVERLFTKDNPGEMPTLKGKWDNHTKKEQTNFLYDLNDFFESAMGKWLADVSASSYIIEDELVEEIEATEEKDDPEVPENDDLPF
jgi:hypothetical protein